MECEACRTRQVAIVAEREAPEDLRPCVNHGSNAVPAPPPPAHACEIDPLSDLPSPALPNIQQGGSMQAAGLADKGGQQHHNTRIQSTVWVAGGTSNEFLVGSGDSNGTEHSQFKRPCRAVVPLHLLNVFCGPCG